MIAVRLCSGFAVLYRIGHDGPSKYALSYITAKELLTEKGVNLLPTCLHFCQVEMYKS